MREPPECKWLQGEGERVCNYLFGDRAGFGLSGIVVKPQSGFRVVAIISDKPTTRLDEGFFASSFFEGRAGVFIFQVFRKLRV